MKSFVLLAFGLWAGTAAAESRLAGRLLLEADGTLAQEAGAAAAPGGLRKGKVHAEFWGSDIQVANMAVKFGGGPFYLALMAGFAPGRDSRFSFGLGVGGHLNLARRLWLDMDVAGGAVQPVQKPLEGDGGNILGQARLMLGFQVLPRLAVFAGPTYNAWFVWGQPDFNVITRLPVRENQMEADQRLQHWPGFQVGLHI